MCPLWFGRIRMWNIQNRKVLPLLSVFLRKVKVMDFFSYRIPISPTGWEKDESLPAPPGLRVARRCCLWGAPCALWGARTWAFSEPRGERSRGRKQCPGRRWCGGQCVAESALRGEVGDHVSFHHRLQTFSMSCWWRTWQWIGETGVLVLCISETHAWKRKHYFCLLFSRCSVNKCAFMCLNTEVPQISWKIHRIELLMWLVSEPACFQRC